IERAAQRLEEAQARGWFQLDREGDAWPMLLVLAATGHWFTVRSAWDRVVAAAGHDKQYLRAHIAATPRIGSYDLDVPANGTRGARRARMVVHAASVTLQMRDERTSRKMPLSLHVVWVHEEGTAPAGEKGLDWMLLTNAPVSNDNDARRV